MYCVHSVMALSDNMDGHSISAEASKFGGDYDSGANNVSGVSETLAVPGLNRCGDHKVHTPT